MIVGVGIDLCSIERFERSLRRHGSRFLERVFAAAEVRLCRGRPAQHLAARFAAKEAFAKAVRARSVPWLDVWISTPPGAPPRLGLGPGARALLVRAGATGAHVSLAHDGGIAAAVVVIEGDGPRRRRASRRSG